MGGKISKKVWYHIWTPPYLFFFFFLIYLNNNNHSTIHALFKKAIFFKQDYIDANFYTKFQGNLFVPYFFELFYISGIFVRLIGSFFKADHSKIWASIVLNSTSKQSHAYIILILNVLFSPKQV